MGTYRVGAAVGGAALEPGARAGSPAMKWLQPLSPDTRNRNGWRSSSIQSPSVRSSILTSGSICHHLQSLHRPQSSAIRRSLISAESECNVDAPDWVRYPPRSRLEVDTLSCVRDHVPLVSANGRVRSRALSPLPHSSPRCAPSTEGSGISQPSHVERVVFATASELEARRTFACSPMPSVCPPDYARVPLVLVVQMARESVIGGRR